jgi:hypothetical protein
MVKAFYILDSLSKNQKSSFVSYVKIFTKKNYKDDNEHVFLKIHDELLYFLNIGLLRYEFIFEFLDDPLFKKDVLKLIDSTISKEQYKEKQKPYYEKQKIYLKQKRKQATEWRQSIQKPTDKQVSYYFSLCKKANIVPLELTNKSKLDLKNMIASLLNKEEKTNEL